MTAPTTPPAGHGRPTGSLPDTVPDTLPTPLPGPAPARVQRRRTAGWRMPAGAVYVGRPTRWGNPYRHDGTASGRAAAVAAHAAQMAADPALRAAAREQLAGRDLACWCPAGQPCHAETLLAIANPASAASPVSPARSGRGGGASYDRHGGRGRRGGPAAQRVTAAFGGAA